MKKLLFLLVGTLLLTLNIKAYAAFNSGSSGALGAFNPAVDTLVALPDDGVLNYTTVNIPAGVTVTFARNTKNTPVYMLATGDVIIAGTINVGSTALDVTKGGPGGFDGGYAAVPNLQGGTGLGPGGGGSSIGSTYTPYVNGGGGGFGSAGVSDHNSAGGVVYGNQSLVPLIGGSGGGGGGWNNGNTSGNGGGGGGAIVIASSASITVDGSITANGRVGSAGTYFNSGGAGSGGAIKLVANVIGGNGNISAVGGVSSTSGGSGRVRIEAFANNRTAATNPPYSFGNPGNIFVPNLPSLNITSVAGYGVPASASGSYSQPDILLPSATSNPVTVNLSAANIPINTVIKVRVVPQYGSATSVNTSLTGTQQASTATANITLTTNYANVITAEATFTVVAMYYNGEEIERIRVELPSV